MIKQKRGFRESNDERRAGAVISRKVMPGMSVNLSNAGNERNCNCVKYLSYSTYVLQHLFSDGSIFSWVIH